MVYCHYKLFEWEVESPVRRAKCMAHWLHARIREAYLAEEAESGGGKKSGNLGGIMSALGM